MAQRACVYALLIGGLCLIPGTEWSLVPMGLAPKLGGKKKRKKIQTLKIC